MLRDDVRHAGRVLAELTDGAVLVDLALRGYFKGEAAVAAEVAARADAAVGLAVGVIVAGKAADRVDTLLRRVRAVGVDQALRFGRVIRLADAEAAGLGVEAAEFIGAGLVAEAVDAELTKASADAVRVEDALAAAVGIGQAEAVLAGLTGRAVGVYLAGMMAEAVDAGATAALEVKLAGRVTAIGHAGDAVLAADAIGADHTRATVGIHGALGSAARGVRAIRVCAVHRAVLIVIDVIGAVLRGGLLHGAERAAAVAALLVAIVALLAGVEHAITAEAFGAVAAVGAVGVGAVDQAVKVVVEPVGAVLGARADAYPCADRVAAAVEVRAVDQTIAVVVLAIVAGASFSVLTAVTVGRDAGVALFVADLDPFPAVAIRVANRCLDAAAGEPVVVAAFKAEIIKTGIRAAPSVAVGVIGVVATPTVAGLTEPELIAGVGWATVVPVSIPFDDTAACPEEPDSECCLNPGPQRKPHLRPPACLLRGLEKSSEHKSPTTPLCREKL